MDLTVNQYITIIAFLIAWVFLVKYLGRGYLPGLICLGLGFIILLISFTITPAFSWVTAIFGIEPICTLQETIYAVRWRCSRFVGFGYGLCAAGGTCTIWQFLSERYFSGDPR